MVLVLIAAASMVFLSYYFAFGARKPAFIGGKSTRLRNILKVLSGSRAAGVYWPTPWSYGGHLHTIVAHVLKRRVWIDYTSEDIEMPDGGIIKLDWNLPANDTGNHRNIVLILPGLTGTSHEKYVLHFVHSAQSQGYQSVVMNYRGSQSPPKTYRFNCASDTTDLEFVLDHIRNNHPGSRVCALGVSMGGMILANHLATHPNSSIYAALVVSIPWDVFVCRASLEKPITWLFFNLYLTRKLQRYFAWCVDALRAQSVNVPEHVCAQVKKVNTIREFDEAVIAPMFVYKDVDEYHEDASPSRKSLESINRPLLCLNAADDPFSPNSQIPVDRIKECENVAMILTQTGGHVGFLEGLLPTRNGYMTKVFEEFIKVAFEEH